MTDLPWGVPLTHDDLQGIPDDGHRYELIDGVLLVTTAPITIHQRVSMRLFALLLAAIPPDLEEGSVTGEQPFETTFPFIVTVVPAALVA